MRLTTQASFVWVSAKRFVLYAPAHRYHLRKVITCHDSLEAGEEMRITDIEPVGAYGLNLVFADGHRRGIYPFQMLAQAAP